jgi:opacity protein-like surface antigen
MRKAILGAASAVALASPAVAADLAVPPPYSQGSGYHREIYSYHYRTAPPVIEEPAPVVVQRPVVVAPPPVIVEEYPVYAAPRVYAYGGPIWGPGWGWGHRHYFHGGW